MSLIQELGFINGQWVEAKSGARFSVLNPFNGECLAQVADMGVEDAVLAVEAAEEAKYAWMLAEPAERKAIIECWADLIEEHLDELTQILTSEQGKPLSQARAEYDYALERMRFMAGEALRVHGQTLAPIAENKRNIVVRQPFGVVAGVAPWNFPVSTILNKIVPALAAGNTVVVKPAQDTPLTALAITMLAERAGFPNGVLNVLTAEDPVAIGEVLTTHPLIRKFSFTGSTAVGKQLYAQCASTVKNIALELGGNSPFIVFEDADIEQAAEQAAALKFSNCGQICVNANRFFVHDAVYDEFVDKLTQHAKQLVLGSGLETGTTLGPMINEKGIAKVEALLEDALSKGAKIETGGQRIEQTLFFQPTVLTNVDVNMRFYREEIFGPIAPVYHFTDEAQVIAMANDTEYGLAAYFYTNDLGRSWRVSHQLEAGTVCVNACRSFGGGPFGGYKASGIGREQGRVSALDEWCEVKSISIAY